MKYAFIIMGNFDMRTDFASTHGDGDQAQIIGVSSIEKACLAAQNLCAQGVDCIELCGAFGPAGAKEIIKATENKIPIGYVTHLPQQDPLYKKVFGGS